MATLEQRIYDANRAKEVLENEAYIQAFADIENEIIEKWKTTPARDAEGREKLWMYLAMLKKFKSQLDSTLQTGKLAQLEVEHKQNLLQRLTTW
ncbi:hypothetical protein [Undibacterium sp. TJN19]|uniref:hypothetical protein n=1 Tax=Undibacterium sp. TJN19 TaxID=3413055 RepID=UPI003BF11678